MLPDFDHLNIVRKLKGDALVTYPGADKTVYKVERIRVIDRGTQPLDFGTTDKEYTSAKLTAQHINGGDANSIEVYYAYEILPGVAITTTHYNDDGDLITTTQQRVLAADIVNSDEIVGGQWVKKTRGEGDAYVATQITENQPIPSAGKIIIDRDEETNARMRIRTRYVDPADTKVQEGDPHTFDGISMYCVKAKFIDVGSVQEEQTTWMELPPDRTLYGSRAYPCPAIFYFTGVSWAVSGDGFTLHGPFPGVNYNKQGRRSAVMSEEEYSYTIGKNTGTPLPVVFTVVSPGDASRLFPIEGNTIHNAIFAEESGGAGTQTIEDIPASTPTSYTIGEDMTIGSEEKPWKYPIFWQRKITTAHEPS